MGKILQFGEGNFLRCFVEYKMQQTKNNRNISHHVDIITPINTEITRIFSKQSNKYNTVLRGKKNGEIIDEITAIDVIESVVNPYVDFQTYKKLYLDKELDLVISNTTEAGIVSSATDKFEESLNVTFPAKITQMLFERFELYGKEGGVTFLCVELIENNATQLKNCVLYYADLWCLSDDFKNFIIQNNNFCNTLVDRIVTGHPKDMGEFDARLEHRDELLVVGEPYFLWVIESDESLREKYAFLQDDEIIFTKDSTQYRERKVKILNGSHTMLSAIALLSSIEFVGEAMKDVKIRKFLNSVIDKEISPTFNIDKKELESFKHSIFERFENPFVNHSFWAISLNGMSKWKTRNLCSFIDYHEKFNAIPKGIAYGLSAMIVFYLKNLDKIQDDKFVIDFFLQIKDEPTDIICEKVLENSALFGVNLNEYSGLYQVVCRQVSEILDCGIKGTIGKYENY